MAALGASSDTVAGRFMRLTVLIEGGLTDVGFLSS
jgi:hypothetical protein